ncbi:YacL family protein [Pasteurella skyensis]|uniref:YacL family protein n=1 Tax=Phocoenobacter skyensis TaxID=97481 RepID=A0AAJ6P118_9PAST|nr:YacL family protein [Pasteurella skyensis]MDP8163284.1 YacL family protein [Pasteurella skyensis]MDP8173249.1 YacL family protein [Pasteurella skyensis]MDP8176902.1 YacL family protein [Pasteurella skyensis]MDP8179659.1 YacL family protein [Pasteurella skyensis]MDP8182748.1 YacL family protein [Pasteurella skyensis]
MEYQFTRTALGMIAKCSMEHEAFAYWINNELEGANDLTLILNKVAECKKVYPSPFEWSLKGKEYSLYIENDEVTVKANNLAATNIEKEQLEEGFDFYTQESFAICGIDDFEQFLLAYQSF